MTNVFLVGAMDFSFLAEPAAWISLVTLTLLEIVLGIDNIVFIAILAGKLPQHQQKKARQLGLTLALGTRILLLCGLKWVMGLDRPLFSFTVWSYDFSPSGRDLILFAGGLFLLTKSTREIHEKLEGEDGEKTQHMVPRFAAVIVQILLLDIVLTRLGHHRRGHGETFARDDYRRHSCGGLHARVRRLREPVHRKTSDS